MPAITTLSRRRFVQLSSLTLAALSRPGLASAPDPRLRFAVVGLGSIADTFMQACAQSKNCKVTALVSGHAQEKAPKYQSLYGIAPSAVYSYDTFDQIAGNPEIDAVYIALPNSMHAEYTIRAAKAGKHVLCEKPMAISSAECRDMITACRDHRVKLMIAYRIHFDPMWLHIRDLAHSGAIGDIQGFQGGFYGQKQLGDWRLDRKLAGGGSLFDLGIYPLNAIRWIAEEEPAIFGGQVATREHSPRFRQMEETVEFSMKFPSGILATAGSSYGEDGGAYLNIGGSKGFLQVKEAFGYNGLNFSGETTAGSVNGVSPNQSPFQFTQEADYFAECVRDNVDPSTGGEEGYRDLLAIEAIYRAAGTPVA